MTSQQARPRSSVWCLAVSTAIMLLVGAVSCSETREERYPTYGDAVASGALRRGVLPPFVVDSASDLLFLYDLDTSGVRAKFRVPPDQSSQMVAQLRAVRETPPSPRSSRPGVPRWWPHEWGAVEFFEYAGDSHWYVALEPQSGVTYAWTRDA